MTHGSLFSGIGGFDLAAQWAGIPTLWQVEKDPFCRAVLRKHFPEAKQYEDIKDVQELECVDIISGGFPCQPVSIAGKKKRQSDARWLWPEYSRIVRQIRPRFVIVENVPGLLNGGMADVLRDLALEGYDAEWDCVSASQIGAPHRRERIWIVAHARGQLGSFRKLFDQDSTNIGEWWKDSKKWGINRHESTVGTTIHQRLRIEWRESDDKPETLRLVDGFPGGLDQLRGLGNAIVPQIAYQIFKAIREIDTAWNTRAKEE